MLLKYRRIWLFLGFLLISAIIILSLAKFPNTTPPLVSDKIKHALAYAVLMGWFIQLYSKQYWQRLALSFFLLGFSLELIQGLTSYRTFELLDLLANTSGIIIAWLLCSRLNALSQILAHAESLLQHKKA